MDTNIYVHSNAQDLLWTDQQTNNKKHDNEEEETTVVLPNSKPQMHHKLHFCLDNYGWIALSWKLPALGLPHRCVEEHTICPSMCPHGRALGQGAKTNCSMSCTVKSA